MAGVARPTFELESSLTPEVITRAVSRRLKARGCPMCGLTARQRIELHVPSSRQHFWSPQLVVDLSVEAGRTRLLGQFGPHPHVWTLYVAVTAASVFALLVAGSFTVAQLTMGRAPTALWALPIVSLTLMTLYFVAVAGRRFGTQQMGELREFVVTTLSEHPPKLAREPDE